MDHALLETCNFKSHSTMKEDFIRNCDNLMAEACASDELFEMSTRNWFRNFVRKHFDADQLSKPISELYSKNDGNKNEEESAKESTDVDKENESHVTTTFGKRPSSILRDLKKSGILKENVEIPLSSNTTSSLNDVTNNENVGCFLVPSIPPLSTIRKSSRTKRVTTRTNSNHESSSKLNAGTAFIGRGRPSEIIVGGGVGGRGMVSSTPARGNSTAKTGLDASAKSIAMTPILVDQSKTITREARCDELLVSMNGSPVHVGGTGCEFVLSTHKVGRGRKTIKATPVSSTSRKVSRTKSKTFAVPSVPLKNAVDILDSALPDVKLVQSEKDKLKALQTHIKTILANK